MEMLTLILALIAPWGVGIVWLRWRWHQPPEGAWAMVLGYGYVVGALLTTFVMRALDVVGVRFSFAVIGAVLLALILFGLALMRAVPWRGWGGGVISNSWRAQTEWRKVVFVVIAAMISVRLLSLGLEVISRPLFPWDAWTQWATKARVWYEYGRMVPFVEPEAWLSATGPWAFTDAVPNYPGTVPLLQVWTNYGLGHWDDALMNLPWLLCAVALGFAFYGQARIWGVQPMVAIVASYFLLSLPMLNTHVALAGYPDIFMATVYCLAAMAFFQWVRNRDLRQGLLALGLALCCVIIKRPGIIWMLTFLPAIWVALMPRAGLIGVAAIGAAGAIFFWVGGVPVSILNYSLAFSYTPVWGPLLKNMFAMDNWHLFWYLFLGVVLWSLPKLFSRNFRAMTVLVLSGIAFLGVVFFFSNAAVWVADFTTVNRALLHIVPMLLFYALILWHNLVRE